jgi:hypothetical protein
LIFGESHTPQELGVFDVRDEPIPLQFYGECRELVQHDPSDAFAAQLFGNDKIEDANGIGFDVDSHDRYQLADELSEESGAGVRRSAVLCGERADRTGISGFDGSDEELLAFHDGVNGRLRRGALRPPTALLSCFYSISWSAK